VGRLRAIQGDIFDYLLAVLPEFGLSLYQQPSGNDLRSGLLPAVLGSAHILNRKNTSCNTIPNGSGRLRSFDLKIKDRSLRQLLHSYAVRGGYPTG
jgi:hypothetical protein